MLQDISINIVSKTLTSQNSSCNWCTQVKDVCTKCWKSIEDLLESKSSCKEDNCENSINLQYYLIEESWIDPLTWIMSYAERFRTLWEEGVLEQDEMKRKLYN